MAEISGKIANACSKQMKAEFDSAYIYLGMSGFFEERGLSGMAKWMLAQFKEEQEHGLKFFRHAYERGGKIELLEVSAPKRASWKSPIEVFESAYAHEKAVTGMIYSLMDLARKEGDYAFENLLQWFVNEQIEEEAQVAEIVSRLKLGGEDALLIVDSELGKRSSE